MVSYGFPMVFYLDMSLVCLDLRLRNGVVADPSTHASLRVSLRHLNEVYPRGWATISLDVELNGTQWVDLRENLHPKP